MILYLSLNGEKEGGFGREGGKIKLIDFSIDLGIVIL